jgi:hypothetical protein
VADRVIQRAVTTLVLRRQRQPGQVPDRPVRAQHRVSQLRQLIRTRRQAPAEIHRNRDSTARNPTSAAYSSKLSITAFAAIMGSLASTHDHAGAALTRRDTPDNHGNPATQDLRG